MYKKNYYFYLQLSKVIVIGFIVIFFVMSPRRVYALDTNASNIANNNVDTCKNCVAFRLDDFDDVNFPGLETRLVDFFQSSNTSMTLGIIAGRFGNNENAVTQHFLSYVIALLKNHNGSDSRNDGKPIYEIANHGWQHEDFSKLSLQKQDELMKKSDEKIHTLLGIYPSVFIAPFNQVNNDTYQAAAANGMRVVSADPVRDPPTLYNVAFNSRSDNGNNNSSNVLHLPYTVLTAYVDKNGKSWDAMPLEAIKRDTLDSIKNHGYAVIEMHPQEFVTFDNSTQNYIINQNHLQDIENFVQWLHLQKIKVVTLGQFAAEVHRAPEFDISSYSSSIVPLPLAVAVIIVIVMVITSHRFNVASLNPKRSDGRPS